MPTLKYGPVFPQNFVYVEKAVSVGRPASKQAAKRMRFAEETRQFLEETQQFLKKLETKESATATPSALHRYASGRYG